MLVLQVVACTLPVWHYCVACYFAVIPLILDRTHIIEIISSKVARFMLSMSILLGIASVLLERGGDPTFRYLNGNNDSIGVLDPLHGEAYELLMC